MRYKVTLWDMKSKLRESCNCEILGHIYKVKIMRNKAAIVIYKVVPEDINSKLWYIQVPLVRYKVIMLDIGERKL